MTFQALFLSPRPLEDGKGPLPTTLLCWTFIGINMLLLLLCRMQCTGASRRPRQMCTIPSTSALVQKEAEERAAIVLELLVHALLALCFVMSTMPPSGQLIWVLKCLIKLTFTLCLIGLGPKTRLFRPLNPV